MAKQSEISTQEIDINYISVMHLNLVTFDLQIPIREKKMVGTCLLSKLSIPRLHDEEVSTITTHPTKKNKKNRLVKQIKIKIK